MATLKKNPATGLMESYEPHFQLPVIHQRSITSLRFQSRPTALHTVALRHGRRLDFYARLTKSDEIAVTFHGANRRDKNIYPKFERVTSLHHEFPSHLAFADPTLLLDSQRNLLLGWYCGGPGWDPLADILLAIERAQARTGAKHVVFIGGSGGGFAALRASAMLPGSLAYVQSPATSIRNSLPNAKRTYFGLVWKDWDQERLIDAFPERFSMPEHYASFRPRNFVYYTQSTSDPYYIENHYVPFYTALGSTPSPDGPPSGRRWFSPYDGEKEGHGVMTPPEFRFHLHRALDWWRAAR
ncbi:hypothetical protein [Brachybacterium phenoliresistens]|uniref:hypothetical protein n=1 Tax=Brachybacterium phenoliresistens TaxID=396014 RepID=UPI0031E2C857